MPRGGQVADEVRDAVEEVVNCSHVGVPVVDGGLDVGLDWEDDFCKTALGDSSCVRYSNRCSCQGDDGGDFQDGNCILCLVKNLRVVGWLVGRWVEIVWKFGEEQLDYDGPIVWFI